MSISISNSKNYYFTPRAWYNKCTVLEVKQMECPICKGVLSKVNDVYVSYCIAIGY